MPRPPSPRRRASLPPLDPQRFAPSIERPLRGKVRQMAHQMDIQPHRHDWAQLVFSINGAVRVSTQGDGAGSTYLVPPSRAVWIPPGVVHAVTAVERANLRTLYLHESAVVQLGADGAWGHCRVLEVSPLMRELVLQLVVDPDAVPGLPADVARERTICALILDEMRRARSLQLGLPLPREGRLRRLCEAMLDQPLRHADIEGWAAHAATSARTLSRWFREELGTSYGQWRQQLLLAQALLMAARKQPMRLIAAELGYASPSAFSAMVTRAVGVPPSRFFAEA
ncbi:helix-turn-helix transcriptional regulator [Ideonella sp.]|uniref:AraC family transcriptional regulator n=1 Tax=Ideonella sp. TaxID=1929293 RepID=UPI002B49235B|nr:helix-turn-helix transcriptional regulator [Ideonella sp.]HJV68048.1 helix-turn-helix transcriptional regulator [Ideonella sp.]